MLINYLDQILNKIGKFVATKKVRTNRLQQYLSIFNLIILLSIKFEGKKINLLILTIPLIVFFIGWFDKRYVHKHEIAFLNTQNDFVNTVLEKMKIVMEKMETIEACLKS